MDRPRYVAFQVEAPAALPRRAVAEAVQRAAREAGWPQGEAPQLTRYAFPHGIVRVPHERLADVRRLLPAIAMVGAQPVRVATLRTSGTLLALTSALGLLQERSEPAGSSSPRAPAPPPRHRAPAPAGAAGAGAGAGAAPGRPARPR